jgi:hypothetical protein
MLRRQTLLLSGALLSLLLVAPACEGDGGGAGGPADSAAAGGDAAAEDRLDVAPADLTPDALVFAWSSGGGFLRDEVESFHVRRHGHAAVWVYGDGTVVTVGDRADPRPAPCRDYRTARLSTAELGALLALVRPGAWAAADGQHYDTCPLLDAGGEGLYVAAGGFTLRTSAWTAFDPALPEQCRPEEGEPAPPDGLGALSAALRALRQQATAPYEGAGVVVAGCRMGDRSPDECAAAPALDATFVDPATFAGDCVDDDWSPQPLDGVAAQTARAWFGAAPATIPGHDLPHALVRAGDECLVLTCDEVLPHDGVVDP